MLSNLKNAAAALGLTTALILSAGCPDVESLEGTAEFPRKTHPLGPPAPGAFEDSADNWHYGSGLVTGTGPEQPIEFPHYRHVTELGMQCEYCHHSARKSIHGGVPETKVCAGCHWQVKKDNPQIARITSFGEGCDYQGVGMLNDQCEPIPWKKVHDLPDFVHFAHKRHVQAGVQCTECHGQIGLQGRKEKWKELDEATGEMVEVEGIKTVMARETTMQMGWCLDCHADHPSVDENYGEKANLRRAELKDCWTCHK